MTVTVAMPAVLHLEVDDDVSREQLLRELPNALEGTTVLAGDRQWDAATRQTETTGSAIVDRVELPRFDPTPPPTMWMEAVARAAVEAFVDLELIAAQAVTESIDRAVAKAMTTPPPVGPGGPNDGGQA